MTAALVAVDPDGLARRTRLARDIGEALAKLAVHATPTSVAITLAAGGWTGLRNRAGSCPVARHLSDAIPDLTPGTVRVIGEYVVARDALAEFRQFVEMDAPDTVRRFVERFDNGAYPELVEQ